MNIYSSISANKMKTWLIMLCFILFITTIVYVFSKTFGQNNLSIVGFTLIFSGVISLITYYYSDKIVLKSLNAKLIEKKDNFKLYTTVENLCIAAGLPAPKIYLINDPSPNAFATGRDPNHAILCFTTGILEKLNKVELEGVTAHELSHIKNYDIRLMSIVAILVGFIAIISDLFFRNLWFARSNDDDNNNNANLQIIFLILGIIFAILSPIIATLIQLAISRKREYLADASGALLTRYPEGLASALEKISSDKSALKKASNATAHLFISSPFKGKNSKQLFTNLFETHPPIEERIRILRSM